MISGIRYLLNNFHNVSGNFNKNNILFVTLQGRHLDVIGFNRYNGWYANPGQTQQISNNVVEEATNWHRIHNKPVIMLEYGADTIEGLHLVSLVKH